MTGAVGRASLPEDPPTSIRAMADNPIPPALASAVAHPEPSRTARLADAVVPRGQQTAVQTGFLAPGGSGSREVLAAVAQRVSDGGGVPLALTGRRLERTYPLGALGDLLDMNGLAESQPPQGPGNAGGRDGTAGAGVAAEQRCRDLLLDRLSGMSAADGSRGASKGDAPASLLVDDAQWLDEATLRVLVGVVERAAERDVSVIVAHRPMPGDANLAALDAALARRQPLVWLGPLSEQDVAERVALRLDRTVEPALIEAICEQTAGVQDLVDQLALADLPNADIVDPTVVAAIRTEFDQLPPTTRTVLTVLSAGADLDDHLLGSVTGLAPTELGTTLELLRAAGLVRADADEVIPIVAAAVLELTPVADRRRFHATLAKALSERGAPPMQAAEHLAAAGVTSREAATTYLAAGEACLPDAPELARTWFDRAAAAGAPGPVVAARQAEAAALDGDIVAALRQADSALGDPATPDRHRALAVVAALLPSRGFWARASVAYGDLGRERPAEQEHDQPGEPGGQGSPGLPAEAARLLALVGSVVTGKGGTNPEEVPTGNGTGSLELEALTLAARGLVTSLDSDTEGIGQAEAPFLEAAELLESGHSRLLLPDSPHALGATVALAVCELAAAEHLLTRALEHDVGGRALRLRHRLLLGWVAVRRGRWSAAQAVLDETRNQPLAPRETLLATAIDAGLARRGGDLARLSEAWRRAEEVLLRHPADLLSLDAIGELAIAASRLGLWDRISAKAHELGNVVRASGEPPLWVLPLRWTGLQVALASADHEALVRRASEVASVRPVHPRLGALADAAATWVDVMGGTIDPERVSAAAQGLRDLSLAWEASRLTGQAAIRSEDPSVTRSLLEQARDLKAALPSAETDETPSAASVLSEREQMVAQHVMDGLTYKEIGAQLYISPKTVEHHVAKIRQKLGASTRAEMLAALRSTL